MKENQTITIVRLDKETGESYISLSDFKDIVDISLVESYSLEQKKIDKLLDEPVLTLVFYDKDGNVILPNKVKK